MKLANYFENNTGLGILSTADKEGKVNGALYARPHIQDNKAIFLAAPNHTLRNIKENAYAHYLFKQDGQEYEGVRLQLKLQKIDQDQDRADELRRKHKDKDNYAYILEFEILEAHNLIGRDKIT